MPSMERLCLSTKDIYSKENPEVDFNIRLPAEFQLLLPVLISSILILYFYFKSMTSVYSGLSSSECPV